MGAIAAKMTMDATVWLAENRKDISPEVTLGLAKALGDIAERGRWVAPGPDFDATKQHDMDEINAFLESSNQLLASVVRTEGMPEEQAAIFSSIANFMGYKVP
jgi:hypothetical protein